MSRLLSSVSSVPFTARQVVASGRLQQFSPVLQRAALAVTAGPRMVPLRRRSVALPARRTTGLFGLSQSSGVGVAATPVMANRRFYSTSSNDQGPLGYALPEDDHHVHGSPPGGDVNKKAFAYLVMGSAGFLYAAAVRSTVVDFIDSMNPSADVLALASIEVDLTKVAEGDTLVAKWRGKPVFVRHRTQAEIDAAREAADLKDPQDDSARVQDPAWLVVIGVCTHLGCVPIPNQGEYNGWFCPCHGSHYDTSGRIRKGPAPLNLEIPPYKFIEDNTKIRIG